MGNRKGGPTLTILRRSAALLDQIDAVIGSVKAAVAPMMAQPPTTLSPRARDTPLIIPSNVTAVLSATADHASDSTSTRPHRFRWPHL